MLIFLTTCKMVPELSVLPAQVFRLHLIVDPYTVLLPHLLVVN